MFFSVLNQEEKESFFQIATYAMKIDSDVDEKELEVLRRFCNEMNIAVKYIEIDLEEFELEHQLNKFQSPQSKRVLYLELLFLILIDKKLADAELDLIVRIGDYFKFDKKFIKESIDYAKKYADIYYIGEQLILN